MKQARNVVILTIVGLVLIGVGFYLALALGTTRLSLLDLLSTLFSRSDELDVLLIRDVRLPRVIAAFFVGGSLALSGSLIQGATRNPIAEPSILGVSQSAIFVVSIFYAFNASMSGPLVWIAALIGSILGLGLVLFILYGSSQVAMTRLLLAGTAISTLFLSLTSIVGLLSNKAQFIAFWIAGGLRNTTWLDTQIIIFVSLVCLLISLFIARKIDVINLGDDVAIGLGVHPFGVRLTVLILVIPLIASTVAVGKNIAFVGLIIPQIIRSFIKSKHAQLFPLVFIFGGILVVLADLCARLIVAPYELPIGVFTALLGVPFFIHQALRIKR